MELLASFLGACVFTFAISFGVGKRLTEHPAGRPILGALGFLIVIAGYSYSRYDFELFTDLVMWFSIVCSPVLVGGAISSLFQHEQSEVQHKSALENKDLDYYSVKSPRVFTGTDDELEYGVSSADEHS